MALLETLAYRHNLRPRLFKEVDVDPPSILDGDTGTVDVAVANARTSMMFDVWPNTALSDGIFFSQKPRCLTDGTVRFYLVNASGGTVNHASFKAVLIGF